MKRLLLPICAALALAAPLVTADSTTRPAEKAEDPAADAPATKPILVSNSLGRVPKAEDWKLIIRNEYMPEWSSMVAINLWTYLGPQMVDWESMWFTGTTMTTIVVNGVLSPRIEVFYRADIDESKLVSYPEVTGKDERGDITLRWHVEYQARGRANSKTKWVHRESRSLSSQHLSMAEIHKKEMEIFSSRILRQEDVKQ